MWWLRHICSAFFGFAKNSACGGTARTSGGVGRLPLLGEVARSAGGVDRQTSAPTTLREAQQNANQALKGSGEKQEFFPSYFSG